MDCFSPIREQIRPIWPLHSLLTEFGSNDVRAGGARFDFAYEALPVRHLRALAEDVLLRLKLLLQMPDPQSRVSVASYAVSLQPRSARLWAPFALLVLLSMGFGLSGCGQEEEQAGLGKRFVPIGQSAPKGGGRYQVGKSYEINGVRYSPHEDLTYDRTGKASWYGSLFHGRLTANGEIFDMARLSAAHPTLPLPVYVEVTNLDNERRAVVRVNDRGPFRKGRLIDLSRRSAEVLGFKRAGTARVRVRYLRRAPLDGDDRFERDYLGTKGYSQYAAKAEPDAGPEVVIAVGPPGPPPAPPLPDRPDRSPYIQQARSAAASPETIGSIPRQAQSGLKNSELNVTAEPRAAPMIQAGTFVKRANAERARGTLAGIAPVRVTEVSGEGAQMFYRIEVGPFNDGIEAATVLSRVTDAGYADAKIVENN